MNNQTGFNVWERMLGDEGEQQEEDCYTTEMRMLRGILGVLRRDHICETTKFDAYYTLSRSTRLCAVAVFVGLDKSKQEMRTPSPAEWWTWQYQVPEDKDAPRRHGTNRSTKT